MTYLVEVTAVQSAVREYLVHESSEIAMNVEQIIAALPAQGVRVKPLIWTRADEDDGVPQWVSGIYFIRYTAAGYKLRINGIEMPKRYLGNDADEQAKADAYKDHAARIVAALAPAEAGGVEAIRAAAIREAAAVVTAGDTVTAIQRKILALIDTPSELKEDADKLRRTVAARDRRITRLVDALNDARAKGYVTGAETDPAIVQSAPAEAGGVEAQKPRKGETDCGYGWPCPDPTCVACHPSSQPAPAPVDALVKAAEPDYCYDDEWEYTLPWGDRDSLVEYADLTKPVPIYTLLKGPTKWAVNVPLDTDGDGEADDFELTWFDSEDAALAALRGGAK